MLEDAAGNIVDGHYRVRAWRELQDEGHDVPEYPRVVRSDLETDAEKRELAWRLNMQRRHLNQGQKREAIAAKLKETPDWADNRIAELLGVDGKTVRTVRTTLEEGGELQKADVLVGKDGKAYPRNQTRDPAPRPTTPAVSPDLKLLTKMRIPQELSVDTRLAWRRRAEGGEEKPESAAAKMVEEAESPLYSVVPDLGPESVLGASVEKIEHVEEARYTVRMSHGRTATVERKRLLEEEGYKKCQHCSGYGITKEEES